MVLIFMHGHLFVLQGGSEVPLQEVLSFFSGASQIPPLGFDAELSITFSHDAVYPTASTCSLSLTLPAQYEDYCIFKQKMTQVMTWHGSFGLF